MRSVGERVLQLERTVADLQTELNASRQRLVSQAAQPQVRIATIATAPTSGSDKAFGVVFNDGTFDTVPGPGSVSYAARQSTYKHVAYNLGDKQPAMGDKVLAFLSNGRWWFAVHEGSSTPVFSEPAINVFGYRELYYVSGPNAGQRVGHVNTGTSLAMWYGESVHQQADMSWEYQWGQDFGASAAAAGGYSLNLSQIGTYRVTVSGLLYRFYEFSMSPAFPDPPRTYFVEINFAASKSLSSQIDSQRLIVSSTMTTDEQCTTTPGSNFENEQLEVLSHNETVYGETIVKTLSTNTGLRFRGTIYYDSGNEAIEFGAWLTELLLTIEKLD